MNGYVQRDFFQTKDGKVRVVAGSMAYGRVLNNIIEVHLGKEMGPSPYDGNTPTTIETTLHEMGHVYYQVKNTAQYLEFRGAKTFGPIYDGHGSGDKSGVTAKEWEFKKD